MQFEYSQVSRGCLLPKKNSSLTKRPPLTTPSSRHFKSASALPPRSKDCSCDPVPHSSPTHELQAHLRLLQHHNSLIETKFQRCIDYMLAEIDKNNQANAQLARQVQALREEVQESKKDILVLEEYVETVGRRRRGLERAEQSRSSAVSGRMVAGSCSGLKKAIQRRTPLKLFANKLCIK